MERIAMIEPYELRVEVACIVWWDYGHLSSERWEIVNQYKPHWKIDEKAVANALVEIGYPKEYAKARAVPCLESKDYYEKIRTNRRKPKVNRGIIAPVT